MPEKQKTHRILKILPQETSGEKSLINSFFYESTFAVQQNLNLNVVLVYSQISTHRNKVECIPVVLAVLRTWIFAHS